MQKEISALLERTRVTAHKITRGWAIKFLWVEADESK